MLNKISIIIIIWFLVAIVAGGSGLTLNLVPPMPQIILFGLVIVLLLLYWLCKCFREWILSVNLNVLLTVHLTRFVGFYFLYLYSLNRLPYEFAVLGGWGDIIVAAWALVLILFVPLVSSAGRYVYIVWNLVGLLDILFVVSTAGRQAIKDPESMSELLKLPLSLLPTFLVPIIIFTHIVIFIRLRASKKADMEVDNL